MKNHIHLVLTAGFLKPLTSIIPQQKSMPRKTSKNKWTHDFPTKTLTTTTTSYNYPKQSRVPTSRSPSFAVRDPKFRVGWEELEGKKSEAKPMTTECRFQHLGADFSGEKKNDGNLPADQKGSKEWRGRLPGISDGYILDSHFWVGKENCSTGTKTFFFWGGATPQKVWVNLGGQIKRCHTWVKEYDLS